MDESKNKNNRISINLGINTELIKENKWSSLKKLNVSDFKVPFELEIAYGLKYDFYNINFQLILRTKVNDRYLWCPLFFKNSQAKKETIIINSKTLKSINNATLADIVEVEIRGKRKVSIEPINNSLVKITSIGTCRIYEPLKLLAEKNYFELYSDEYKHTTKEIIQLLYSIEGKFEPDNFLIKHIYKSGKLSRNKLILTSDIFFIEISSIKELKIGDTYLKLNLVRELLITVTKEFRILLSDLLSNNVKNIKDPKYAIDMSKLSLEAKYIIENLESIEQSKESFLNDMKKIIMMLGQRKRIILVSHFDMLMDGSDTQRVPERVIILEWLSTFAKKENLELYNPRFLLEKFGTDKGLLDNAHYTKEFDIELSNDFYQLLFKKSIKNKNFLYIRNYHWITIALLIKEYYKNLNKECIIVCENDTMDVLKDIGLHENSDYIQFSNVLKILKRLKGNFNFIIPHHIFSANKYLVLYTKENQCFKGSNLSFYGDAYRNVFMDSENILKFLKSLKNIIYDSTFTFDNIARVKNKHLENFSNQIVTSTYFNKIFLNPFFNENFNKIYTKLESKFKYKKRVVILPRLWGSEKFQSGLFTPVYCLLEDLIINMLKSIYEDNDVDVIFCPDNRDSTYMDAIANKIILKSPVNFNVQTIGTDWPSWLTMDSFLHYLSMEKSESIDLFVMDSTAASPFVQSSSFDNIYIGVPDVLLKEIFGDSKLYFDTIGKIKIFNKMYLELLENKEKNIVDYSDAFFLVKNMDKDLEEFKKK